MKLSNQPRIVCTPLTLNSDTEAIPSRLKVKWKALGQWALWVARKPEYALAIVALSFATLSTCATVWMQWERAKEKEKEANFIFENFDGAGGKWAVKGWKGAHLLTAEEFARKHKTDVATVTALAVQGNIVPEPLYVERHVEHKLGGYAFDPEAQIVGGYQNALALKRFRDSLCAVYNTLWNRVGLKLFAKK